MATTKTVAERQAQVEEAAKQFASHLMTGQGAQLEAPQRWFVCAVAVAALDCSGCATLRTDACLKPGLDAHQLLGNLKHAELTPDVVKQLNLDEKQVHVITTIVHSLINHQGRIDEGWHDAVLSAIKEANIIPNNSTESQCQSALVEIIVLACLAHSYHVAFLFMGKQQGWEVPPIASIKDAPKLLQEPRFDPQNMLKPGQSLQRDDTIARSAFFVASQVDRNASTFTSFSKEAQDGMLFFADSAVPWVCCSLVPQYAPLLLQAAETLYYDSNQLAFLFSFLTIRAEKCPGVTRHDMETVAAALTGAHSCAY